MNDLIRRSDVLEILEEVFKQYNITFGQEYGGFAEAVPKAIKNIPIAYDVNKVVEQLKSHNNNEKVSTAKTYNGQHRYYRGISVSKAVKIVKNGVTDK